MVRKDETRFLEGDLSLWALRRFHRLHVSDSVTTRRRCSSPVRQNSTQPEIDLRRRASFAVVLGWFVVLDAIDYE